MAHNFIGLNRKHDNFRKGVFIDPFDEPTYLTFALDFKFEDTPAPNGPLDEVNLWNSPLFKESGNAAAIPFLLSRGYTAQASAMKTFREILRYLTFQAPWYFQEIQGLSQIYQKATDQSLGQKSKDINLKIQTLEAVDLRIHELAGLYRNSIFDTKFRRERVPDNLRWFSVDIYIAEFRNLRFRLPGVAQGAAQALGVNTSALGNIFGGGNVLSNVMDQYGYIKFSCRQCEFDFSETLPTPQSIKIGGQGRVAEGNQFGIKVGWVEEEVKFGDGSKIYDDPDKTNIRNPWGVRNVGTSVQNFGGFLSGLPVVGDDIAQAGQNFMSNLSSIGGLLNPALNAASNFMDAESLSEINTGKVEIGDVYSTGYASNGDQVPEKAAPSEGKAYSIGYSTNDAITPEYPQPSFGDSYAIGYETNGDRPPKWMKPPTNDVYNTGYASNGDQPAQYLAEPSGDAYTTGYASNGDTPAQYESEPSEDVYSTGYSTNGDQPAQYGPEPSGDVYNIGYPSNGDQPAQYGPEPNGDAYPIGYSTNGDQPAQYGPEPSGDVYNIGYPTNGDQPAQYGPEPSGDAYPIGYPSNGDQPATYPQPSGGDAYSIGYPSNGDQPAQYGQEPNGDAYPIGYPSNGDAPAMYPNTPTGDAYPIGYPTNGDQSAQYPTEPGGNIYN